MKRMSEPGIVSARWLNATAALLIAVAVSGCPVGDQIDLPSNYVDGNLDESLQSPLGKTSGEPNDDFAIPVVAVFDDSDTAGLKGTVASEGDLDVYLLGSLDAGDRVMIDADAVGTLDVSVAVFDGEGKLAAENDDRSNSDLDAHIDFVARHDSDRYYLVVTHAAFASIQRLTGTYIVGIEVDRGGEVPTAVAQTVFLKFDGGRVDSPRLGSFDLEPFDAATIHRSYSGETQIMKQAIVDVMRQNYERFSVTVLSSDDFEPAPGDEGSTIFFGGFNSGAYGIAEDVDLYNQSLCDDAIIYTESFSPADFSAFPSAEEMGIAIGNVAAHEAGHLLGLNHVDDDLDLMDDRSLADAFLLDQEFMESILSTDIMPIGTQDGVLLLTEIVGPSIEELTGKRRFVKSGMTLESLGGVEVIRRQSREATKRGQ